MRFFKSLIIVVVCFSTGAVYADSKCENFNIHWAKDGWARINGVKPETQKVTFTKKPEDYNNSKIQWMVSTNQPGIWYGMDFIIRNGKSILNVQLVQASMDAPKIYGTYDCVKVK